ncbi:MAG: DUF4340 domain-containing protein [Spirochaetes bacterium]|nr:DUF4340 domain-containing protein [Spirochaetota bacterium]
MKNKRIVVSFVIIAVLLLYLVLSNTASKNDSIPDITKLDKIDEILITKDNITINLKKKDKDWYINDQYLADGVKVNKLETGVRNLEMVSYISNDHYIRYDLTPEKSIHVLVKNEGQVEREILIGKASTTDRNAYVRIADDEAVYLANSNLNSDFTTTIGELREKEIHKFASDVLTWLQVSYKGKTMTFEKRMEAPEEPKDENKEAETNEEQKEKKTVENWYYAERGNARINKEVIDPVLSAFSTVRAAEFPEVEKKNLKGLICMIKGKIDDKEVTMKIHNKFGKEAYICSSTESDYAFTLEDWSVKRFFKEPKDFK